MALTDNLISQIYPVAGETSVLDYVGANTFTGTGTATLIDGDGAVKCWLIPPDADLRASLSGIDTTSGEYQFTIALRVKLVANGSDSFAGLAGIVPSSGTITSDGARLLRSGTILRARFANQGSLDLTGVTGLNTLQTVVFKYSATNVSATDQIFAWVGGVARSGDSPNFTSATQNWNQRNFDQIFLTGTSGASFQLYDMAIWNRGLTDAEAASVADNYRGVMPSAGAGGGTSNITISETLPALSDSMSMTFTPDVGTSNITINDTLPSLDSSLSMTYASGVGTITISDWANNTGTALPSITGITVAVRSLVDGSTVYRTTTAFTDVNADCVVSDAAIISGTQYEVTALKFNGVDYDIGIAIITAT